MFSRDRIIRETSPLSIFFVKSGSSGNRLLFRYPFDESFQYDLDLCASMDRGSDQDRLQLQSVISENDDALCNMFSVNPNLCGQKFEIKINSVRHVGHPMSLLLIPGPITSKSTPLPTSSNLINNGTQSKSSHQSTRTPVHNKQANLDLSSYDPLTGPCRSYRSHQGDSGDITSFNIVCALRASASYDIVDCYHDLSKRLAIALSFEERRCSYLSKEIKIILTALEESDMANLASRDRQETSLNSRNNASQTGGDLPREGERFQESVFSSILNKSNLARDLKRIFVSLTTTGIVDLKINNWVSVSFCLPQKVHRLKLITHESMPAIGTKDIKRCLLYLRPYHGLLLLQEPQELLDSLPLDASPAFIQLIRVTKPDKNLMDLSVDSNLALMQIFCIVSQLIYWAKATVIYPICDSNIYAIHPLASIGVNSRSARDFKIRFPSSKSLHHYLSDFSDGTSLSQLNSPLLSLEEKLNLLSIVTWLLQRRILTQIHKYIFLVVEKEVREAPVNNDSRLTVPGPGNTEHPSSSPQGIEMNAIIGNNTINVPFRTNGVKLSSAAGNSYESSPQLFKNSLSESADSSVRRYRTDSMAESQEDSNFGLNSSLSSTPNSNLEYPSPGNEANMRSSFSSSCPLDNPLAGTGDDSIQAALKLTGLSQSSVKSILAIPSSKNLDDIRLLIRLIPFFDGKHHVEDIMFFENLERSQVLILCDKFRDVLFTCHYEDVAVSQLSPFNSSR